MCLSVTGEMKCKEIRSLCTSPLISILHPEQRAPFNSLEACELVRCKSTRENIRFEPDHDGRVLLRVALFPVQVKLEANEDAFVEVRRSGFGRWKYHKPRVL